MRRIRTGEAVLDDGRAVVLDPHAGGETGVWVASRMGENVFPMDCSDVPYVSSPARTIILDRAARNTVRANWFSDVTYGVRVEDDGTSVINNSFAGPDGSTVCRRSRRTATPRRVGEPGSARRRTHRGGR